MLFFLGQKTNIDQKGMLAAIFGDVGLDEVDDVWPNGGLHDIRERDVVAAVCSHIRLEHLNGDERVGVCELRRWVWEKRGSRVLV